MRITFVADGRSPIAQGWISTIRRELSAEPLVLSTYPCPPHALLGPRLAQVPVAFGGLSWRGSAADAGGGNTRSSSGRFVRLHARFPRATFYVRNWVSPLTLPVAAVRARRPFAQFLPDVVHALRLPYEGFLAQRIVGDRPLVGSIWGNDLTLFARRFPVIGRLTRKFLQRADGLVCDCERDAALAREWGYSADGPVVVLPGGGGVDADRFKPGARDGMLLGRWNIPEDAPVVFNPRGIRPYARTDTWFRAIPAVLREHPDARFVATGMARSPEAEAWVRRLQIGHAVHLLPPVTDGEFASLMRTADVVVSLTTHDGTPNTLLQAMASGAFVVAGDLPSIREWIRDGRNGFLCSPTDPSTASKGISMALASRDLRSAAEKSNRAVVLDRAECRQVGTRAISFYEDVVARSRTRRVRAKGMM